MHRTAAALHEKIRNEIMRRILRDEYKVGYLIPSAVALAGEFGVSAITVRRALRDLQPTGAIRTIPGLGTFVPERRRFVRELDFSLASVTEAREIGLKTLVQLASVTRERIRTPMLREFDAPSSAMVCIRQIVSIDGTPTIFGTSYLPLALNDNAVDDCRHKFVADALRDRGIRFRDTRLLIVAAPASQEAQQAFGIPNGYPTLRRLYQLTTADRSFSVFGIAESPFDRLACKSS